MGIDDTQKFFLALRAGDPIVIYFDDGTKEEGEYFSIDGGFISIKKNGKEYKYRVDRVIRARQKQ